MNYEKSNLKYLKHFKAQHRKMKINIDDIKYLNKL